MNNNLKAIGLIFLISFFIVTITAFKKEAPPATDYKVIYSKTQFQFQQTVKTNLALGWQLQGGVAVDSNGFYQAMTR
jgi:hypothetical protein